MELMERKAPVNECSNSEPTSPGHVAWLMRLFLSLLNPWCFINREDQFIARPGTVGWKRIQLPSTKSNYQDFTCAFWGKYNLSP